MRTHIYGLWRFYVAYESSGWENYPSMFSRAWIIEMAPPYRKGKGIRVRAFKRAFQVGICKKNQTSDALRQVGGRPVGGMEEISQW